VTREKYLLLHWLERHKPNQLTLSEVQLTALY